MRVADLIRDAEIHAQRGRPPTPTVSVLMPTFRRYRSGLLDRAVRSVLAQTERDLELVIVDDGSTDGTFEACRGYVEADPRVSLIRHARNCGLPAVREYEAFRLARGAYLAFMFDDDEWEPDALEVLLAALAPRREPAVAYGWAVVRGPDGLAVELGRGGADLTLLRSHNFISNHAILVARPLLEEVGLYDPHIVMKRVCDWDLLRRLERAAEFVHVDRLIGRVSGPATADSLGNTQVLDYALVSAWMSQRRDARLRPDTIEAYEVDAPACGALRLPAPERQRVRDLIRMHRRECAAFREGRVGSDGDRRPGGREPGTGRAALSVLVVARTIDASVDLYLQHPLAGREDVTVRVVSVASRTWPLSAVLDADVVVIVRALGGEMDAWVRAARLARKGLYYFLDDNLFELAKMGMPGLGAMAGVERMRATLASFDGVLASTPRLIEYMERTFPAPGSRYLLPASYDMETVPALRNSQGAPCAIGYFGGGFRAREIAMALEALGEVAGQHPVVFHCNGIEPGRLPAPAALPVEFAPFDVNYGAAMRRARRQRLSIMLCPSFDAPNVPYKSLCKITDATALGSVAIVSDTEPYRGLRDAGVAVLCENTPAAWAAAIRRLLERPAEGDRLFAAARALLAREHDTRKVGAALVEHLAGRHRRRPLVERWAGVHDLARELERSSGLRLPRPGWTGKPRRDAVPAGVAYARLAGRLRYRVRPEEPGWNGVELVVSTTEPAVEGWLRFRILAPTGAIVRTGVVPFSAMNGGVWTRLEFDPVEPADGRPYLLEVRLVEPTGPVAGLYELPPSRRWVYWTARLARWSPVRDNLYARLTYA
jgi:glycosyltransferase involved in cell wall biosynthesis